MKRILALCFLASALFCASSISQAQVTVTVDPGAPWLGYMNVFELPSNGGGYVFGSGWGTPDLVATFSGPVLTLAPNNVNPPNGLADTFWYNPDGSGNKIMAASFYQEVTGPYSGINLTFTGKVLSNTFTSAHSTVAFIKDFAADYSSHVPVSVPLNANGTFSVSMNTIPVPGRHVQFGFETTGVNVWAADVAPFGNIQITAVPEPSSILLGLTALGGAFLIGRRR
jgi:hypothetical protein